MESLVVKGSEVVLGSDEEIVMNNDLVCLSSCSGDETVLHLRKEDEEDAVPVCEACGNFEDASYYKGLYPSWGRLCERCKDVLVKRRRGVLAVKTYLKSDRSKYRVAKDFGFSPRHFRDLVREYRRGELGD